MELPNSALLHLDFLKVRPLLETLSYLGSSRKFTLKIQVTQVPVVLDLMATRSKSLDNSLRVSLATAALQHRLKRLS